MKKILTIVVSTARVIFERCKVSILAFFANKVLVTFTALSILLIVLLGLLFGSAYVFPVTRIADLCFATQDKQGDDTYLRVKNLTHPSDDRIKQVYCEGDTASLKELLGCIEIAKSQTSIGGIFFDTWIPYRWNLNSIINWRNGECPKPAITYP